jgi:hypothetical protein
MFDDLDGAEGARTVSFSLEAWTYEVDLTPEHAAELRKSLEPWITAGRRVTKDAQPGGKAAKTQGTAESETAKVRAWAREEGLEVSDRGRIPAEVREAYRSSH